MRVRHNPHVESVKNRNRIYPSLKAWREEADLTQEAAAQILGVSQAYYSKLEQQQAYAGKKLGKRISELARVPLENVLGIA